MSDPYPELPANPTVEDWKKARATLLEEEKKLSDIAVDVALGERPRVELMVQHNRVVALRALTEAVLGELLKEHRLVRRRASSARRGRTGDTPSAKDT